MTRTISRWALCAALATMATSDSFAQSPAPVSVRDPVALFLTELPLDRAAYEEPDNGRGLVLRVTRDYNNDGRADIALSYVQMCGEGNFSTGCSYEVFLRAPGGTYLDVGALDGSVQVDELEPVQPGVARLLACRINPREETWIDPIRISERGMTEEPSLHPSAADWDAHCMSNGRELDFVFEQCSIRDYLHTGRCTWTAVPQ